MEKLIKDNNPPSISTTQKRKKLIPLWIKVFGWLFMLLGAGSICLFAYSAVTQSPISLQLFGLNYYGTSLTMWGIIITGLMVIYGISAFGLLFAQDWGFNAAVFCGFLAIIIGLSVTLMSGFRYIRLEPFIAGLYLIHLAKFRHDWSS